MSDGHQVAEPSWYIPPYVCCAMTEGRWTIVASFVLIITLMTVASMRHFKRYLAMSRFNKWNMKLMRKLVDESGKNSASVFRPEDVPVDEFVQYCALRRTKTKMNEFEYFKAVQQAHYDDAGDSDDDDEDGRTCRIPGAERLGRDWIVCRGPTMDGVGDFWGAVWSEGTSVIVMLTRTFECIRLMCAQYWPSNVGVAEAYGRFRVKLAAEETFAHHKISTLLVRDDEGSSEERLVRHFHYLDWPAYSPPTASSSFLLFVKHLHEELERCEASRPPLVHCHDGRGRTGAFLAIEANLFKARNEGAVNIFETLRWLREQRRGMLANRDQYRFVYEVIEDHVVGGNSRIPVETLALRVSALAGVEDGFQKEFRGMGLLRKGFAMADCAAGHMAENRKKNRNPTVVPPDERRPRLTSMVNAESVDYINAVFVDGYHRADEIICTEWPMNRTKTNFWSLIYDHSVTAIVVLSSGWDTERFWPQTPATPAFRDSIFSVETKEHSVGQSYDAWLLELRKVASFCVGDFCLDIPMMQHDAAKTVALFQLRHGFGGLAGKGLPKRENFLHTMTRVAEWRENNDPGREKRTVVVSHDGVSSVGIYCVASYCFDQLEARGVVDVFQAVRNARVSRHQLVRDAQEYRYCHQLILDYAAGRNLLSPPPPPP